MSSRAIRPTSVLRALGEIGHLVRDGAAEELDREHHPEARPHADERAVDARHRALRGVRRDLDRVGAQQLQIIFGQLDDQVDLGSELQRRHFARAGIGRGVGVAGLGLARAAAHGRCRSEIPKPAF
jgi:hypothetical protein